MKDAVDILDDAIEPLPKTAHKPPATPERLQNRNSSKLDEKIDDEEAAAKA